MDTLFWTSGDVYPGSQYFQGITGSQSKIVMTNFDVLDDTATATTIHNTLCGTDNGEFWIYSAIQITQF